MENFENLNQTVQHLIKNGHAYHQPELFLLTLSVKERLKERCLIVRLALMFATQLGLESVRVLTQF